MTADIDTSVYLEIAQAVYVARKLEHAYIILGPPGIGKSYALKRLARDTKNACYLHLSPPQGRTLAALRLLCDKLDIIGPRDAAGCHRELERWFKYRLIYGHEPPVLFIDEAQYLVDEALKTILDFTHEYKVPVILCGNPHLLKITNTHDAGLAQINSRIARVLRLSTPNDADYVAIAKSFGVVERNALAECVKIGQKTGHIRELVTVLKTARALSESENIGLESIVGARDNGKHAA